MRESAESELNLYFEEERLRETIEELKYTIQEQEAELEEVRNQIQLAKWELQQSQSNSANAILHKLEQSQSTAANVILHKLEESHSTTANNILHNLERSHSTAANNILHKLEHHAQNLITTTAEEIAKRLESKIPQPTHASRRPIPITPSSSSTNNTPASPPNPVNPPSTTPSRIPLRSNSNHLNVVQHRRKRSRDILSDTSNTDEESTSLRKTRRQTDSIEKERPDSPEVQAPLSSLEEESEGGEEWEDVVVNDVSDEG